MKSSVSKKDTDTMPEVLILVDWGVKQTEVMPTEDGHGLTPA
jgi:hypothetical protein